MAEEKTRNPMDRNLVDEYNRNFKTAKEVASVLAKNGATVGDLNEIFRLAGRCLAVVPVHSGDAQ